jgi:uncharacterized phage protein (TIGR02218 family)
LSSSKFEQSIGLGVDDISIDGVIDGTLITSDDIRDGKFDAADVEVYIVNWSDPSEYRMMVTGQFGNLTEEDGGGFITDFQSMSDRLRQAEGRSYQRTCDTKLGSALCGVDLSDPLYSATSVVSEVSDQSIKLVSLSGFDDEWFTLGKLITASGYEVGIRTQKGSEVNLWRRPTVTIEPGDVVQLEAGCRQTCEVCHEKFDNRLNFRGFNLMPGQDSLTSYPLRGENNDGGSLFS